MRCHICNADMNSFNFNRDHGDIDPCGTCLAVINDVFTDEPDDERPASEVEPTPEEMLNDAEDLASGRIDVV